MTGQPFHHGNLRAVLLAHAEQTLREHGVDALSLRQLARQAGVSHGAPRRHFADRQALLDALAERGFDRLTDQMRRTPAGSAATYEQGFTALATAYVRFAISDPALLELMFTAKSAEPSPALQDAAERFFTTVNAVTMQGLHAGRVQLAHDPYRLQMLLVATLHGIATLVAVGRFPADQVDDLIAAATTLFTGSAAAQPPQPIE